jgi:hypothetical protein
MNDKNDDEGGLGFKIAWSWTGVTFKISGRFASAVDAWGGYWVSAKFRKLEADSLREEALNAAESRLIEIATEAIGKEVRNDLAISAAILESGLKGAFETGRRKQKILDVAYESLSNSVGKSAQEESGPDSVSAEFMSRLGQYAAHATTEDLQEKWGLVLAQELRAPGTFGPKVMRLIDEINADLAAAFQEACKFRIGIGIPEELVPGSSEFTVKQLQSAGLLMPDPPLTKRYTLAVELLDIDGAGVAAITGDHAATGWNNPQHDLKQVNEQLGHLTTCWYLTEEGYAISTIFPNEEMDAVRALRKQLRTKFPSLTFLLYTRQAEEWLPLIEP